MSMSIIAHCPKCNEEFLFKTSAKRPRPHCPSCKHWFYLKIPKTQDTPKQQITKSNNKPDPPQVIRFIDDPDELLLSVAIRELNKPDPDSRWASILIACKKEKITNKGDAINQFKSLPTQALVNLLNKSSQEEY